jgi:hypothetical protein
LIVRRPASAVTPARTESFNLQVQRVWGAAKGSQEVNAMRNVLRIAIVLSAIMGLLVVQRAGANAGVLSGTSRN